MSYKFNAFVLIATVLFGIGNGQVRAQAPDNQKGLSSASDNGFQYAAPFRRRYRIPLNHISSQYVLNTLKQAVSGSLQPFDWQTDTNMREIEYIIANERDNSLLISASPKGFSWLRLLVKELDLPRQVTRRGIDTQNPLLQLGENDSASLIPVRHLFRISLSYTSPRFMLNKLNQAVSGSLQPFDWNNEVGIHGIEFIVPDEQNHFFLIFTTAESLSWLRTMVKNLDVPQVSSAPSGKKQKPPVGLGRNKQKALR